MDRVLLRRRITVVMVASWWILAAVAAPKTTRALTVGLASWEVLAVACVVIAAIPVGGLVLVHRCARRGRVGIHDWCLLMAPPVVGFFPGSVLLRAGLDGENVGHKCVIANVVVVAAIGVAAACVSFLGRVRARDPRRFSAACCYFTIVLCCAASIALPGVPFGW
jgi:hypothetical protein